MPRIVYTTLDGRTRKLSFSKYVTAQARAEFARREIYQSKGPNLRKKLMARDRQLLRTMRLVQA